MNHTSLGKGSGKVHHCNSPIDRSSPRVSAAFPALMPQMRIKYTDKCPSQALSGRWGIGVGTEIHCGHWLSSIHVVGGILLSLHLYINKIYPPSHPNFLSRWAPRLKSKLIKRKPRSLLHLTCTQPTHPEVRGCFPPHLLFVFSKSRPAFVSLPGRDCVFHL